MKVITVEKPKAAAPKFEFGDHVIVKDDQGGYKDVHAGDFGIVVGFDEGDSAIQVYGKDSKDYDYFKPEDLGYADRVKQIMYNLQTAVHPGEGKVTVEFTFDELANLVAGMGAADFKDQADMVKDIFPAAEPFSYGGINSFYRELKDTVKGLFD